MCEHVCNAYGMTRRVLQRRYDKESIATHHKKLMSREYCVHHIGKESIAAHAMITRRVLQYCSNESIRGQDFKTSGAEIKTSRLVELRSRLQD